MISPKLKNLDLVEVMFGVIIVAYLVNVLFMALYGLIQFLIEM